MMHEMSYNLYAIRQKIDQSTSTDELVQVIEEFVPHLARDQNSRELYQLLVDAFQALRTLTAEDVQKGEQIIQNHLLGYLEQDSHGSAVQKYATSELRECLDEWIEQYPERERMALRAHILDDVLAHFQVQPVASMCWTLAHIGYREQRVVEVLWNCVRQDEGELGDTALVTLTALGVPPSERPALLRVAHQRITQRISQPLLVALLRLADPASLPIIRSTYFSLELSGEVNRDQLLALTVFAEIADAFDADEEIQDQVWQFIAELYERGSKDVAYYVNLGGAIAARCDSSLVVPTVLRWLGEATDEEKRNERNPLLYYRLEECLRPRQLEGWQQYHLPAAIDVLRQSACLDTRFEGRSATREIHEKEAAWGILFRMGYAGALDWFERAVSAETNRYVRRTLCDLFACFSLDPLPPDVLLWVRESFDAQSSHPSSAELIARMGAVEVAHSAASVQAFEALLDCGLTFGGQQLLASVEALADVALVLAREGNSTVIEMLLDTAVHHPNSARRIAAGRALESLAAEHLLPAQSFAPLVEVLLTQEERDPYERSFLIATLAQIDALPNELLLRLKQWARDRDDWLAIQSFAVLAQRDALLQEEDLLERLGLQRESETGEVLSAAPRSDWQAHVIGLLYQRHPEVLVPAVARLIETLPWASAIQIIGKLHPSSSGEEQPPLSEELADALMKRIQHRQTRTSAELDLIYRVGELLPEHMAEEPWDNVWNDWLPDARAALADALGSARTTSTETDTHAVRLLLLLTADGQYAVRRAAYRGLARRALNLLQLQCWAWAESDQRELRQRAAEACAWLPGADEQNNAYGDLYQMLVSDPEQIVRKTAVRMRQERLKRRWAQEYLNRVLHRSDSSNDNILATWCYAEALKRLGDDTTLQALRTALGDHLLPPHIRHWYQFIFKETQEGWQKAMKKWPQPGRKWTGAIEEGNGVLLIAQEEVINVHYSLWSEAPESPRQMASWGGTMQVQEAHPLSDEGRLQLRLADGRQGEILLKERNLPSGYCSFIGQGPYPLHPIVRQ